MSVNTVKRKETKLKSEKCVGLKQDLNRVSNCGEKKHSWNPVVNIKKMIVNWLQIVDAIHLSDFIETPMGYFTLRF